MEIPREISAAEVDRPKMAPGEAASGETAVAAFGAEMEQTSFYGARQELVLQGAQDRVDASALEAKYRDMYETKAEGLDKVPYRDYQKYAQQSIDEVTKEFQNDPIAKDNPRLQSLFSPHLEDYARTFQHATHLRYVKELQRDGYAQFDNEIGRYEQDAAQLPAGAGRDAIFKEMDAKAQDFVKSNLLNPDIVNRRLQAREKNVQESYITNLTGGNNPVDIQHGIDILNAKDSTDTDKIDPEKKAIMKEKAEEHLEKVQNKVDNEKAMNVALGLIQSNHGDADLALAEFNKNTDLQKAMGANTYQKTRQLLNDHIEDKDRFEKEEAKKEYEQASQAIIHRKYAEAEKIINNSKYLQKTGEGLTLTNAIRTRRKRTDDDIGTHEDRKDYARINKLIDEGKYKEAEDAIIKSGHIKTPTADRLFDRLNMRGQKDINHGLTTANTFLRGQIAPSKGALLPAIPEQEKLAADAQEELQKWTTDENKKFLEGKRALPLTSTDIYDHAVEIAPRYHMPIDEQVKHIKESAHPDKNKKKTADYKVGDTYVKDGITYKKKEDGKWYKQ